MEKKTCLIVYIGNGFSMGESSYHGMYSYTIDMRDGRKNHQEFLYKPLIDQGYKVDTALVTNKHKFYEGFKKEYNAINIEYDDITQEDEDRLLEIYRMKVPQGWGPGIFKSGGRFLKLKEKMPEYDVYVFIRTDVILKKSISELSIDYEKMNYLWPETDYHFYENGVLNKTDMKNINGYLYDYQWFWRTYNRVSGNILNIVSKKYITTFLNYFWLEHLSLHLMIKELTPLVTVENDVNLMCGDDVHYVTDVRVCENPVYYFSKKIIS